MSDKTYAWIPKELAERIEQYDDINQMSAAVDEYFENSSKEIASLLESLDEEVAQYKGLMAKKRAAFRKETEKQLEMSYKLWEELDEKRPWIQERVKSLAAELAPISKELERVDAQLKNLNTHRLKDAIDLVDRLSMLPERSKDMMSFLMNNYRRDDENS